MMIESSQLAAEQLSQIRAAEKEETLESLDKIFSLKFDQLFDTYFASNMNLGQL